MEPLGWAIAAVCLFLGAWPFVRWLADWIAAPRNIAKAAEQLRDLRW